MRSFFLWRDIVYTFSTTAVIVAGSVLVGLFAVAAFFFVITRGALLLRSWRSDTSSPVAHVYPVYSEMWFIRLVDFQPIISAILLFQYNKLVDRIVLEIGRSAIFGKNVLITSCAFGNVIPRLVSASVDGNVKRIVIADIIRNELVRAKEKLSSHVHCVDFVEENATEMNEHNASAEINVLFFLLHELPHCMKEQALREAGRVLASGGKLIVAEFHRPNALFLRVLSRLYFLVFEPYGLALWDSHDPVLFLERTGDWTCERNTYFFGNFQIIVATKK